MMIENRVCLERVREPKVKKSGRSLLKEWQEWLVDNCIFCFIKKYILEIDMVTKFVLMGTHLNQPWL